MNPSSSVFGKTYWSASGFSKPVVLLLILLWLTINLLLLGYLGIRTGSDTEVYEAMAYALLDGDLPEGRLLWYISYIALLAAIFKLGGNFAWVVGIQILLSGVAAIFLAQAIKKMSGDTRISLVAVFMYLAWVKIHQWNIFIYTESLFTSLAVISFAAFVLSRRPWQHVLSALLVALTFFARPTGFSFLAGWLVYGLVAVPMAQKWKWATVMIAVGGALLLLNLMPHLPHPFEGRSGIKV